MESASLHSRTVFVPSASTAPWIAWLLGLWAAGSAACLLGLARGVAGARRLVRRGHPLDDGEFEVEALLLIPAKIIDGFSHCKYIHRWGIGW